MSRMGSLTEARVLAKEYLADLGDRWAHVQTVGRLAEELLDGELISESVACAAWLHDIGYATAVSATGFHPVDGARLLAANHWPEEVVGLVAHHTGAAEESVERDLVAELETLPSPSSDDLDAITLIDLSVAPDGSLTRPIERVAEILNRYPVGDPVYTAVTRSSDRLLASAERARKRLRLSDDWPLATSQSVGDAESHRGVDF